MDLASIYRLETVLGWSASARTFRGRHPETGEPVALKTLSPEAARDTPAREASLERFRDTLAVMVELEHVGLPRVLEFGVSEEDDAFIVFAWHEGKTLGSLGTMAPREALSYMLQVLEGLECLALNGLVHLNLSLDNFLLTEEGKVKLLGLGTPILRTRWWAPGESETMTPAAVAPELLADAAPSGSLWRADLFGFAALVAGLLDGTVEGSGSESPRVRLPGAVLSRLQGGEALEQLLSRCLHVDPHTRPASYSEVAKALQHSLPRGPRAERPVVDTQAFDLEELTGGQSRGELDGPPSAEEAEEIRSLRAELEASLNGDIKGPEDLGPEAEIYEGFLELRENLPVELDLRREPQAASADGRGPTLSVESVMDDTVEFEADDADDSGKRLASEVAPPPIEDVVEPEAADTFMTRTMAAIRDEDFGLVAPEPVIEATEAPPLQEAPAEPPDEPEPRQASLGREEPAGTPDPGRPPGGAPEARDAAYVESVSPPTGSETVLVQAITLDASGAFQAGGAAEDRGRHPADEGRGIGPRTRPPRPLETEVLLLPAPELPVPPAPEESAPELPPLPAAPAYDAPSRRAVADPLRRADKPSPPRRQAGEPPGEEADVRWPPA